MQSDVAARDRLLAAAGQLLDRGDRDFSTRAVCDLADVKAPTLYHHFGNRQGLVDAVLEQGYSRYVGSPRPSGDPVADVRAGWDKHVQFGLDHPSFYALLFGDVQPGRPFAPAIEALTGLFSTAASEGRLRVPPAEAAAQVLAANVGVTLSLIARPDSGLSERVREAALAAVLVVPTSSRTGPARATAAIALTAALGEDPNGLTPGELGLLRELLTRLSAG